MANSTALRSQHADVCRHLLITLRKLGAGNYGLFDKALLVQEEKNAIRAGPSDRRGEQCFT